MEQNNNKCKGEMIMAAFTKFKSNEAYTFSNKFMVAVYGGILLFVSVFVIPWFVGVVKIFKAIF